MNYKIIGSDQKEYGPVSEEQLRQWVTEGRVSRDSMIQPEGATDWRPLSSFPELIPLTAPAPVSGGLPPAATFSPFGQPDAAAQAVRVPAIFLIVVGGLGVLGSVLGLLAGVLHVGMLGAGQLPPDLPPQLAKWIALSAGPVPSLIGVLTNVLVLFGALSMMKLQRWGLALAACIIALACGNPCCCPVGLAAGIWGIIVLVRPEVKSAFH
jgi:hypothetical protein